MAILRQPLAPLRGKMPAGQKGVFRYEQERTLGCRY